MTPTKNCKYHSNIVILQRGYVGFTLLSALGTVVSDGSDAIRLFFVRSSTGDCPIPLYSGKTAVMLMMPTVFCVNALGVMFIFIGIERAIATVYPERYEKMKSTLPGWFLLGVAFLASFGKAAWMFSRTKTRDGQPMVTIGEMEPFMHFATLGMQLAIEFVNILIFTLLHFCNKRRQKALGRLSSTLAYKYQVTTLKVLKKS
ncbi:hypothetical protein L596_027167 [Steinernema carpocapsae]|uniref:G-protein coupled receptors family 1 profile domain-containing protein n=2 Tax=Steinernema carpocapsae TaxID=34508 RepID=A0A4U5M3L4_STECR|nr:hypothetical protein L596_027167 [Steinernema carpocapsae]